MRLTVIIMGLLLVSTPVFAEKAAPKQPTLAPKRTTEATGGQSLTAANKAAETAATKKVEQQLTRQVNATQQRLQQEEKRLQSQFAQLQRLRTAALEKQNQQELERIERLERQVVADYQKRVEQILIGAKSQIQAQPASTQTSQPRAGDATKAEETKQQSQKPKQTQQRTNSRRWFFFGRR